MVVEEATRNVRQLRATVAMRGTDERDSPELWAPCMLGLRNLPRLRYAFNPKRYEGG